MILMYLLFKKLDLLMIKFLRFMYNTSISILKMYFFSIKHKLNIINFNIVHNLLNIIFISNN
jgi:hypothetical protein